MGSYTAGGLLSERKKEMKTKTIYNTIYIADDGTEFAKEEDCKKYEETYEKVISVIVDKIPNQESYSVIDELPYFNSSDVVKAFTIRCVDDVEAINKWVLIYNRTDTSQCIGTDTVGTIQIFDVDKDGNYVYSLGTPEYLKERYCSIVDNWTYQLVKDK